MLKRVLLLLSIIMLTGACSAEESEAPKPEKKEETKEAAAEPEKEEPVELDPADFPIEGLTMESFKAKYNEVTKKRTGHRLTIYGDFYVEGDTFLTNEGKTVQVGGWLTPDKKVYRLVVYAKNAESTQTQAAFLNMALHVIEAVDESSNERMRDEVKQALGWDVDVKTGLFYDAGIPVQTELNGFVHKFIADDSDYSLTYTMNLAVN